MISFIYYIKKERIRTKERNKHLCMHELYNVKQKRRKEIIKKREN
jgi:hypothetical protein